MTHVDYLNAIDREPLPQMVRRTPEGFLYIPISVLQPELLLLYQGFTRWEMLRDTVMRDGLWGVGKLHYRLPFGDNEWVFQTGTASIPISKKMRLSYPSLEIHCMLNAAKKIGPWFGQNLNRNEDDEVEESVPVINVASERLEIRIEEAQSIQDLGVIKDLVVAAKDQALSAQFMKKIKQLTPVK